MGYGKFQKICRIALAVLTVFFVGSRMRIFGVTVHAEEEREPVSLYIIYDNSKSMYGENSAAWQQAAYAMETMAAMMGEQDKITIYYMKDGGRYYDVEVFDRKVHSLETIMDNMHKFLNELIYTDLTYIDGLDQAFTDIAEERKTSDNIQLLILSDGQFNFEGATPLDKTVNVGESAPGIKSIYFQMGEGDDENVINVTRVIRASNQDILPTFVDIANLIYERQPIDTNISDENFTFTLELPAKRLIVMAQMDDSSQTSISFDKISGNLREQNSVSYSSIEGLNVPKEQKASYCAAVKIYEAEQAIAPGEYSFSMPLGAEVFVYAEYDVEYLIQLTDNAENVLNLKEGTGTGAFREGTYSAEVWFINTLTGEIIEDGLIYNKLDINLSLDGQEWRDRRIEDVWLSEGRHSVSGTVQLEGNYPEDINIDFDVRHQLGELEIAVSVPENGFDIDELQNRQDKITIQLLEDGENISDLEGLEINIEGGSFYEYEIQKMEGCWEIYPVLKDFSEETGKKGSGDFSEETGKKCSGDFSIPVGIHGERDGQAIDASTEMAVTYYVQPGRVTLEKISLQKKDIFNLFWEPKASVPLLLNNENVEEMNWISNVVCTVTDISGEGEINAELKTISETPLSLELEFDRWDCLTMIWNFRKGGLVSGNMELSLERYGTPEIVESSFEVHVEKLTRLSILFLILASVMVFLLLWSILMKPILRNRFWGTKMQVFCMTYYGTEEDSIRIPVKKQRVKNLFRIFHPQVAISLKRFQYLGYAPDVPESIIVEGQLGGGYIVKNIQEFITCSSVKCGGRNLAETDKYFESKMGLEWELRGKRTTKIKIGFER